MREHVWMLSSAGLIVIMGLCGNEERAIMKKPLLIQLSVIFLIIAMVVGFFLYQFICDPYKMFEKRFGFKLPESSEIVNSGCFKLQKTFTLKVRFKPSDLQYLKYNLVQNFFNEEEEILLPNIQSKWWDINENDILVSYMTIEPLRYKSHISVTVWAFITMRDNGQYYLYICS
jgi:hypothetical protein